MGKGPSISELAAREEEFRKYLVQIRSELEGYQAEDVAALDKKVTAYYEAGHWSDFKPLMQSEQFDVQHLKTWSLDNVVSILQSVRDAMFGDAQPPAGVVISKPDDFMNSLGLLEKLSLMALSKAFAVIQGVLETFATETQFRGQSISRVELVAPGMTLFISIRSNIWRNKSFFENESIGQYLFVLRSYFSQKQAGDISKYNDLLAYEQLKEAFRKRMADLGRRIADPQTPFSAMTELDEELGYYAGQLSKIQAMIEDLSKQEAQALIDEARAIAGHRTAKAALESSEEW